MNELQCFNFDELPVRTVLRDDQPWFVAADVCRVLEIVNNRDAVAELDDDEKNTVAINDGNRGNPNTTIISESGLYALIFKSRKPEAKRFRKWVTAEVLPELRRTGSYSVSSGELREMEGEARQISDHVAHAADCTWRKSISMERARLIGSLAGRRMEALRLRLELLGVCPRALGNAA